MAPALAAGISVLVAIAAWGAGALTPGGAGAAALVGSSILWSTGWPGAAALGAFFLSSTLIGRLTEGRAARSDAQVERRGARQVLANGAAAALGGWCSWWATGLGLWVVTASLAAAAADTWATSMGALSRSDPRSLRDGRRVAPGTSGAVSGAGTLGGAIGATIVAAAGAGAARRTDLLWHATAIGFAGMLVDSLLGAWVQGRFECPACGEPSERRRHHCGRATRRLKGFAWLDNDGINALATTAAALSGILAWRLAGG